MRRGVDGYDFCAAPVDLVQVQSRRLQSGWEKVAGLRLWREVCFCLAKASRGCAEISARLSEFTCCLPPVFLFLQGSQETGFYVD